MHDSFQEGENFVADELVMVRKLEAVLLNWARVNTHQWIIVEPDWIKWGLTKHS